jgi:hypothetical protein
LQPVKKKSKYNNVKVKFDGYTFDSAKEMRRYIELRMLQTIGEITDLRLQVPYDLNDGGTHKLTYYADFVYKINGVEITEDVKGFRTAVYKKKKALMLKVHGISISEV